MMNHDVDNGVDVFQEFVRCTGVLYGAVLMSMMREEVGKWEMRAKGAARVTNVLALPNVTGENRWVEHSHRRNRMSVRERASELARIFGN